MFNYSLPHLNLSRIFARPPADVRKLLTFLVREFQRIQDTYHHIESVVREIQRVITDLDQNVIIRQIIRAATPEDLSDSQPLVNPFFEITIQDNGDNQSTVNIVQSHAPPLPVAFLDGIPYNRLWEILNSQSTAEAERLIAAQQQDMGIQVAPLFVLGQVQEPDFDPLGNAALRQAPPLSRRGRLESPVATLADQMLSFFGYTNLHFFEKDMESFAREILRSPDEQPSDVSPNSVAVFRSCAILATHFIYEFLQALIHGNTEIKITADQFENILHFRIGSGGLTFFFVSCLYMVWKAITFDADNRFTPVRDLVRLKWQMECVDWYGDENGPANLSFSIPSACLDPNNAYMSNRDAILNLLRRIFSKIHRDIQYSMGAVKEYWYHNAGQDPLSDDIRNLTLGMTGVRVSQLDHYGRPVIADFNHNVGNRSNFWDIVFGNGYYKEVKANSVLIPYYAPDGHLLHGCFLRALNCRCLPSRDPDSPPTICSCNNDKQFDAVPLSDLKEISSSSPVIIIEILIFTRNDSKKKQFRVLYVSPDYMHNEHSKVIVVNNPQWGSGRAHCVVLVPPPIPEKETPVQQFLRLGFFNTLLHRLCKTSNSVCPICGQVFIDKDRLAHFTIHKPGHRCIECGQCFYTESELAIHSEYHCRHLGPGCVYEFADEIVSYTPRSEKRREIVYADLESAITEDGTHKTILCGWTLLSDPKVRIEPTISKFLLELKKISNVDEIIVYFHNGENYDFHFVLLELGNQPVTKIKKFDVISDSSEKFRYFSVRFNLEGGKTLMVHFRDTFAFVSQSLAKWVESCKKSGCEFPCFSSNFKDSRKRNLVLQKNPFPYNAITCEDDLENDISMMDYWFTQENAPELFCDKYTKEELEEMYEKWYLPAKYLFGWQTVGDFYRTYLKCDVSQLCDVMEFFAKNVKDEFDLNVHDYYGTPSLTWAAWLRDNKYPLEPLNENIFDVINSSIRGGQTGSMRRLYDSEKRSEDKDSFCCDLDCNSLYATVMLNFNYPCHDWKIIVPSFSLDELLPFLKELHSSGRSGFIESDFIVKDDPKLYSYVPVASKRKLTGIYNTQAIADYAIGGGEDNEKYMFIGLCNVVGEHLHYCCQTRMMEFYLEHGFIELQKVHKIVHGQEEPVFHDYVKHNLDKRRENAKDEIKKMLYKLMNNSLYGKTYEDVTKRTKMEVICKQSFETLDPHEIKRPILDMNHWMIYETYQRLFTMDKPIYLGASITEYSKLWMYRFFYDDIRPIFPDSEVLYTDTDALTLFFPASCEIHSFEDLATRLNSDTRQIIDTSNWPDVSRLPSRHTKHNNEPGLFKSETGKNRIIKMIALRAKTYIMICENDEIKMSVKGCPMKEKSNLCFKDFEQVLFGNGVHKVIEYDALRSKFHIVKSTKLTRVVLSAEDLKRYIHPDRIHTSPFFSESHIAAQGQITFIREITQLFDDDNLSFLSFDDSDLGDKSPSSVF